MAVSRATFYILFSGTVGLLCYFELFQSLKDLYTPKISSSNSLKNILLWNGYERVEISSFGTGHEPFVDNCSVSDCFMTSDRSSVDFGDFDAVVFNVPVLGPTGTPDRLPAPHWRKPQQRFVFFSQESPVYNNIDLQSFAGYFNWTMSFQRHADIRFTYGSVEPKTSGHRDPVDTELSANKTKLIAAFMSHCHTQSQRETYVAELRKYLQIDIYGHCGTLNCSWNVHASVSSPECYRMLEKDYKFFLSFENSLCTDYVTEKLFSILQHQIVPVVMGGVNYSSVAPPHSFINALDLVPRKLADYLQLLDSNLTLYNTFFEWKRRFQVGAGYRDMARQAFCSLCARLNQDQQIRIHHDLQPDFSPKTQCKRPFHWKLLKSLDRFHNVED